MQWNLRMKAAEAGIWKSTELRRQLADAGLVISAGKMSALWTGTPTSIRLDDLDVICVVLQCAPSDLLLPEPEKVTSAAKPATRPTPTCSSTSAAQSPSAPSGQNGFASPSAYPFGPFARTASSMKLMPPEGDVRRLVDLFGMSANAAGRYTRTVDHPDLLDFDETL